MTRICWWLVEMVSRALDPNEREAVRGDLVELGQPAGQALVEVAGLVSRRLRRPAVATMLVVFRIAAMTAVYATLIVLFGFQVAVAE